MRDRPPWLSWLFQPHAGSPRRWAITLGLILVIVVLGLSGKLP